MGAHRVAVGSRAERQEAQQRVKAAVDSVGREEIYRGTVFLVGVLTGHLIAEPTGGGQSSSEPGVLGGHKRQEGVLRQ
ncbi:hypothetical protein AB0N93_36225 [Streptomyces sp. NPDC091267]|uniref:hypothetical protein n=1 Tax=Streptomyces sp. NPDC091267 TaxID=3155195 RepID=UPI00342A02B7